MQDDQGDKGSPRWCHRRVKVDPPTGEKRTRLIVILLALPTDFWTRPIAFLFA
jgi:hypothetical protein